MIVDMLTVHDFTPDIQVLDELERNQKIATYHAVARALLVEDEPPPALTAVIEAAVASVYRHIQHMISMELGEGFPDVDDGGLFGDPGLAESRCWRELALAAGHHLGLTADLGLDQPDYCEWDLLVECLEGRVLWDDDWDMVEYLDAPPAVARRVKAELGIDEDYFVAIPPDPDDADAERLLAELVTLTADAR